MSLDPPFGDSPDEDDEEEKLSEDGVPPPDTPVIKRGQKLGTLQRQRNWILGSLFVLLMLTFSTDFAGAAFLPKTAWTQLGPEVKEVRTWLFLITGPIVGFYFAEKIRQ